MVGSRVAYQAIKDFIQMWVDVYLNGRKTGVSLIGAMGKAGVLGRQVKGHPAWEWILMACRFLPVGHFKEYIENFVDRPATYKQFQTIIEEVEDPNGDAHYIGEEA
jgi:hypothetical protein